MATIKLDLEELFDTDYELIAVHSPLDDFRLAYFINQKLPILLSRNTDPIALNTNDGEVFFSKFDFDDRLNDMQWTLIQNKNEIVSNDTTARQNLFLESNLEITTSIFLMPEFKKVDYFLKIENNGHTFELDDIVKKLNSIEKTVTAYSIEPEKIKSKNNLIF